MTTLNQDIQAQLKGLADEAKAALEKAETLDAVDASVDEREFIATGNARRLLRLPAALPASF